MHNTASLVTLVLVIFCAQYRAIYGLIGPKVRDTYPYEYPAVVNIAEYDPGSPNQRDGFCSGTLISESLILLCEHCYNSIGNYSFQILAESHELASAVRLFPWWWISFDQWSNNMRMPIEFRDNDIAVMKTIYGVSPGTMPGILPNGPLQNDIYSIPAEVVGFGTTHQEECPEKLKVGLVNILRNRECGRRISQLASQTEIVHSRYICSFAEPYLQIGDGDSGGPIYSNGVVIGINKGLIPRLNGMFHRMKINIHVGIEFYRPFIDFHLCL